MFVQVGDHRHHTTLPSHHSHHHYTTHNHSTITPLTPHHHHHTITTPPPPHHTTPSPHHTTPHHTTPSPHHTTPPAGRGGRGGGDRVIRGEGRVGKGITVGRQKGFHVLHMFLVYTCYVVFQQEIMFAKAFVSKA